MINIIQKILIGLIAVPFVIALIPVFLLIFIYSILLKVYIRIRLWVEWPKGTYVLFAYSESENWSDYIEENILPRIAAHSRVINRTIDQNWKQKYRREKQAIEYWASLNINPVAIVFRAWRPATVIPFYEAFRDLKHGKENAINAKCKELYSVCQ
tara:strand:+ start:3729 stop:4193 length:465 start_codon:yes stop_codon:yes gene_type:complete